MARLVTCGFELQSATTGVEMSTNGLNGGAISTTVFRSGNASLNIAPVATFSWMKQDFKAAASATQAFLRVYVMFTTLPVTAAPDILTVADTVGVTNQVYFVIDSADSKLKCYYAGGNLIGATASAITTGVWYRMEIDVTGGSAGACAIKAYVDGVLLGSTTTATIANFNGFYIGNRFVSGSFSANFDDIAVNDSSGTFQKKLPGAGSVMVLMPSAAGDVNTFATQTGGTAGAGNNFTRVKEIPTDGATSFNGSSTLNQEDMFNCLNTTDTVSKYENNSPPHRNGFCSVVYYFDGSNGGTIDAQGVWTNDANAVDSSTATTATSTADGVQGNGGTDFSISENVLQIFGTNIVDPGFIISEVQVRIVGTVGGGDGIFADLYSGTPDFVNATNYIGGAVQPFLTSTGTGQWATVGIPTGGWDFLKLKQLVIVAYNGSAGGLSNNGIGQIQIRVCSTISPGDVINVVHVGGRYRNSAADTTGAFKFEVMKKASGTKSQSASIVPNSTTFKTNNTTSAFGYPITLYQTAESEPWTKAFLDSIQIGYIQSVNPAVGGRRCDISTVWAMVDWTPSGINLQKDLNINQTVKRANSF